MKISDTVEFQALSTVPKVNLAENIRAARAAGRFIIAMLWESLLLRLGPGKVTFNEYFYYRLWDSSLSMSDKRRFVGKTALGPMHLACNLLTWHAIAADKLVFQMLLQGSRLPAPELIAIVQGRRVAAGIPSLGSADDIAVFLRQPINYPLFIKPIDGMFSLQVTNAVSFDHAADEVILNEGRRTVPDLADELSRHGPGYLIQRRLTPHPQLADRFGSPLWSIRIVVLLTPSGPVALSAVAKIATGKNPADNFWRKGNMLAAIDMNEGIITRVVRGTGAEMKINESHPDTGNPILGTVIPDWEQVKNLIGASSLLVPGISHSILGRGDNGQGPGPAGGKLGRRY